MKRILTTLILLITMTTASISQTSLKPAKKGYAPVNGLKMYYEVYGKGEPILLLHGAYMNINLNWAPMIPELAKSRQVIAVEMQGHGHTADIDRPFDYKSFASDVAGLIKHLDIKRTDVIGYSFGGTIALQFGIDHPELVNKMVIISTAYKSNGWSEEAQKAFTSMQPDFLDNTPLKATYDTIAPDPGHWRAFVTKFIDFDQKSYDLGSENIKNISAPILFIMGDNDGVDLSHVTEMYKLCGGGVFADFVGVPKSQLAVIPGKGHVSLMMDTSNILSYVNPFLEGKHSTQY